MMDNDAEINIAANLIRKGGVVIFPTETVYGIGANAFNAEACRNIYKFKNRPSINPLIVHVANLKQISSIAVINDYARKLFKILPAPITLVLQKSVNVEKIFTNFSSINVKNTSIVSKTQSILYDTKLTTISGSINNNNYIINDVIDDTNNMVTNLENITAGLEIVTAGLDTIAVRVPQHPVAIKLIEISGCPIAAPSANKSGMLSSTSYQHVSEIFKNDKIFILKDDINTKCQYGLESTIIDLTTEIPTILRLGAITQNVIEKILGCKIDLAEKSSKIKAPGMLLKHYCTVTPLRINATKLHEHEIGLNFGASKLNSQYSLNLSSNGNLEEAASNLFNYLYRLDQYAIKNKVQVIAVAPIPNESIGISINERLARAAM